jgi:hypothetical protein
MLWSTAIVTLHHMQSATEDVVQLGIGEFSWALHFWGHEKLLLQETSPQY